MTVRELTNKLLEFEKKYGKDIPVILSSDSEGNAFNTTDARSSLCPVANDNHKVIGICVFPYKEGFRELEEAIAEDEFYARQESSR